MTNVALITKNDNQLLQWDDAKTSLQHKLGDLVQYFQVGLPTNAENIPMSYIDPTALAPTLLEVQSPDDVANETIQTATIPIEFDEGFPAVAGVPFWERLDGEAIPYYKLFKEYREMKYLSTTRSISKLSDSCGMSGKQLNALSKAYHWQVRAKAYDKFKAYERALEKEQEQEKLQSKHAKISNQLLDQAVDYLERHPEQLSPKIALQMVEMAMKSGRISVGLNGDKPGVAGSSGSASKTPSININNTVQSADQMLNVDVASNNSNGGIEDKIRDNAKDMGQLQSVLHILNETGALKVAAGQDLGGEQSNPDDDEYDYLDVDWSNTES